MAIGRGEEARLLSQAEREAVALKRMNRELARREDLTQGNAALVESARRALAMKRAARHRHHPSAGRTAGEGMRATPSGQPAVSPDPREIGRVSQFVRNAQARRDSA